MITIDFPTLKESVTHGEKTESPPSAAVDAIAPDNGDHLVQETATRSAGNDRKRQAITVGDETKPNKRPRADRTIRTLATGLERPLGQKILSDACLRRCIQVMIQPENKSYMGSGAFDFLVEYGGVADWDPDVTKTVMAFVRCYRNTIFRPTTDKMYESPVELEWVDRDASITNAVIINPLTGKRIQVEAVTLDATKQLTERRTGPALTNQSLESAKIEANTYIRYAYHNQYF